MPLVPAPVSALGLLGLTERANSGEGQAALVRDLDRLGGRREDAGRATISLVLLSSLTFPYALFSSSIAGVELGRELGSVTNGFFEEGRVVDIPRRGGRWRVGRAGGVGLVRRGVVMAEKRALAHSLRSLRGLHCLQGPPWPPYAMTS